MSRIYCEDSDLELVLVEMDVKIHIINSLADVTLTQKFDNRHSSTMNCFYSFPVDPNSCVHTLKITTPHEEVRAELKETATARSEYQTAVSQGKTAVLMEEKTMENLVMSIGNIGPGEHVTTVVQFFTPLLNEDSNLRFVLPTILSSRYTPAGHVETYKAPVNSDSAILFDFSIETKIESSGSISKIECLTYSTDITEESKGFLYTVKLKEDEKAWKGDYILSLVFDNAHQTTTITDTLNSKSAISISFNPNFVDPEDVIDSSKYDYVFVIDRSGSMSGSRIAQVRDTMVLFLRSLPIDCRFNIIGFGSSFESLFPSTVLYDESNMEKASLFCKNVNADLGGTELLEPLIHIKKNVEAKDRFLNLFVLTDGEVSNTEKVIEAGKAMSDTTRIYTFGIGSGVSHQLVRGLASSARGTAEFIVEGEELDSKVIRSLSSASKHILTNVVVDWKGLSYELCPSTIENMFDGVRKTLYGLCDSQLIQGRNDKTTIEIRGCVGSKVIAFPIEINFGERAAMEGSVVRQAAWTKIRELESLPNETSRVKALALSLETSVMCSQTSFVGISNKTPEPRQVAKVQHNPYEEEESGQYLLMSSLCDTGIDSAPTSYRMKKGGLSFGFPSFTMRRKESVSSSNTTMTSSGGGFFARLFSKSSSAAPATAPVAQSAQQYRSQSLTRDYSLDCEDEESDTVFEAEGAKCDVSSPSSSSAPPSKSSPEAVLRKITDLQKAAGYWTLSQEICDLIGVDMGLAKQEAQQISVTGDVFITSAVVKFIQTRLSQFKDRWILMVNKSSAWLKAKTPANSQPILDETTSRLFTN